LKIPILEGREKMRIIPVLDILTFEGKKHVVKGVRGERNKYFPILSSKILNDSDPLAMAVTFEQLGFEELYIADLDLIQGINKNIDYLTLILKETDLKIMLDIGISNISDLNQLKSLNLNKIIIGTETLSSLEELSNIIKEHGKNKIILSIDLMNNQLMTRNMELKSLSLLEFIKKLAEIKVEEIIFLELTQVGAGTGINKDLIEIMKENLPSQLITGGGVKTIDDLKRMDQLGIDGALVATALHEGTISIEEILKL